MTKRVVYGVANYEEVVQKNGYFVDKTRYIEQLERLENPVFLRPRRFGKSLWCRILECYYNINQKDDFEKLFGHTYIGRNPTPLRNTFFVTHLDFSIISPAGTIEEIEASFNHHCNLYFNNIVQRYKQWFQGQVTIVPNGSAAENLGAILRYIELNHLPSLYVIIDEYDNFSNQLVSGHKDELYRALTANDSFFKTFFKVLKEGRKTGAISNVYITGVLPITIDDMASGFNIATFITLDPIFESMLGFTQTEVDRLLDEIFQDYQLDPSIRPEIDEVIKNQYNGYHFVKPEGESLYNSTILMYFLDWLCNHREMPEFLTDMNLRTDLSWVKRITSAQPNDTEEFVSQLLQENIIGYDKNYLVTKFNMSAFFQREFYPISFYYLGMLTKHNDQYLRLPNMNMRKIFTEYFNELYRIDVSSKYAEMMIHFVETLDLPQLFADYWRLYVSQLPEVVFQQVNENFYRTTFFELCSRHISNLFTWNLERSYPQGRSDLEFVGKYHGRYAGTRIVIEFKYYANREAKKVLKVARLSKKAIAEFTLQAEDTAQIAGYVAGLRQEYPEAKITQYVIYCFGNQGFRVFQV